MTHKVHPKAFRIKGMEDFNSRGFYGKKTPQYLQEDFLIRKFIGDKFKEALVSAVKIEHAPGKVNIIVETARPGLIIGRAGQGVDDLKKAVERLVKKASKNNQNKQVSEKREIKIDVQEIRNPWINAELIGQMIAQQIERRMPFRRVLKKSMERVMQNKEIRGIRIEVAGRLNGIEIARTEWLSQGKMPLGTIRANIDYAQTQANCSYGAIGVKVWLNKGEKFE